MKIFRGLAAGCPVARCRARHENSQHEGERTRHAPDILNRGDFVPPGPPLSPSLAGTPSTPLPLRRGAPWAPPNIWLPGSWRRASPTAPLAAPATCATGATRTPGGSVPDDSEIPVATLAPPLFAAPTTRAGDRRPARRQASRPRSSAQATREWSRFRTTRGNEPAQAPGKCTAAATVPDRERQAHHQQPPGLPARERNRLRATAMSATSIAVLQCTSCPVRPPQLA